MKQLLSLIGVFGIFAAISTHAVEVSASSETSPAGSSGQTIAVEVTTGGGETFRATGFKIEWTGADLTLTSAVGGNQPFEAPFSGWVVNLGIVAGNSIIVNLNGGAEVIAENQTTTIMNLTFDVAGGIAAGTAVPVTLTALSAGDVDTFTSGGFSIAAAYVASDDGEAGSLVTVVEDSRDNPIDVFANDEVRDPADLTQLQTKTGDGGDVDVVIGSAQELEILRVGVWDDANVNGIIDGGEFTEEYTSATLPVVRALEDPYVWVDGDSAAGQVVRYTPGTDFNGTDTFWYEAVRHVAGVREDVTSVGKVTVTVTPVNDIPQLQTTANSNEGPWHKYTEGDGAVNVFTAVTVLDPDFSYATPQTNYNGAKFYAIIENAQTGDALSYDAAVRSSDITLNGARIIYQATEIGDLFQITGGIRIDLDDARADITPTMIQALVTDLKFENASDAPSDAERLVRVFLDDAPGVEAISHHLFEVDAFLGVDTGATRATLAFMAVEMQVDASVRSITIFGNNSGTGTTVDQYGVLTGDHTTGDSWYNFNQGWGRAEWDVELEFANWADMIAAFPAGAPLRIQLNYWDTTSSFIDLPLTGLPVPPPTAPTATITTPGDDQIQFDWANNTGDPAAGALFVEIEGPEMYDLAEDEFETRKTGGLWDDTTHTFTGLGVGEYWAEIFVGNLLVEGNVSSVPVELAWATGTYEIVLVGTTFEASGTITDTTGPRTDADDLEVQANIVTTGGQWEWYGEIETEFTGSSPWDYTFRLAPVPAGYTHYVIQAYIDRNQNGMADLGEPLGQSTNVTTGGTTYHISLAAQPRSWTRDWSLLGAAYLYVAPVNDPPVNTLRPEITGTAQYGQTLTTTNGTWNDTLDAAPAPAVFTYQWYGTAGALGGEDKQTLDTDNYVGLDIYVQVTATDSGVGQAAVRATASATADSQWVRINKAAQTITFGALANKTFGDADFDLAATASSTLAVSYASSDDTIASIAGATVTIHKAGTVTITASQAGDGNYSPAADAQQDLTIDKADQTITFGALAGKTYGDADFDLAATADSTLAVSYASSDDTVASIAGATVTIHKAGTVTITASQAGNGNYNAAADVPQVLNVAKVALVVAANAGQSKTYGDAEPALFTYTITTGALVGGDTLTGALSRVAGEDVDNYAIQQNDLAASANYTLTYVGANFAVTKADQTITFGALPGKTYGDPTFDLAARADSTLPVSYDSSNPAVATVAGSTVTIHGAGATTITASQAGNGNYNAAADVPQVLNVAKVDLTVTANAGQSKAYGDPEPAEFTYTITTGALVGGDTLSGALNRVA
ncbi:MAG: hypothetical protein HN904_01300, partial [Victivallales bacterium]|nr:hypothetical protein [Victivallales bacterium]